MDGKRGRKKRRVEEEASCAKRHSQGACHEPWIIFEQASGNRPAGLYGIRVGQVAPRLFSAAVSQSKDMLLVRCNQVGTPIVVRNISWI